MPRDLAEACGAFEADLVSARVTPGWGRALASSVDVTRERFEQGRSICDAVGGRLGVELRLTWLGGRRILDRVERARFALLEERPTLQATDVCVLFWRALRWRGARS